MRVYRYGVEFDIEEDSTQIIANYKGRKHPYNVSQTDDYTLKTISESLHKENTLSSVRERIQKELDREYIPGCYFKEDYFGGLERAIFLLEEAEDENRRKDL